MNWRLLIQPGLPGYRQMAIDEALYACADPDRPPVLRFYTWQNPTLSLGYFQQYKRVVQESFVMHNKIDVVRRITGGRAVLHQYEVTYALAGPLTNIFANQSLQETYRLIANALNLGLQRIGLDHPSIRADASRERGESRLPQCFVSVSQFEHEIETKKVIGSAQKRSRDRFVQHGSILLDFDLFLQNGCIKKPDIEIEKKIAPLNRVFQRRVEMQEIVSNFHGAFEQIFQVRIEPSELDTRELKLAASLEPLYQSEDWTQRGCR
jgi:lipoyl(octanoyl) transferase